MKMIGFTKVIQHLSDVPLLTMTMMIHLFMHPTTGLIAMNLMIEILLARFTNSMTKARQN